MCKAAYELEGNRADQIWSVINYHALQVHAELAGVGLSIATPEAEVLYMLLDGIRVRATSSKVSRTVEACIRSIQVIPQLASALII